TVLRVIEPAENALAALDERPQLPYLGRTQDMSIDTRCRSFGDMPAVLVEPPRIRGDPKRSALMPTHGLPGFRLQALVDLDCFEHEPAVVVAVRIERNETGGVPGRPGGELGALEQHDIGPTATRQAVED